MRFLPPRPDEARENLDEFRDDTFAPDFLADEDDFCCFFLLEDLLEDLLALLDALLRERLRLREYDRTSAVLIRKCAFSVTAALTCEAEIGAESAGKGDSSAVSHMGKADGSARSYSAAGAQAMASAITKGTSTNSNATRLNARSRAMIVEYRIIFISKIHIKIYRKRYEREAKNVCQW